MGISATEIFSKVWKNILVFDIEAENYEYYGRTASQFDPRNWVMMLGYSYNGGVPRRDYYPTKESVPTQLMPDLTNVDVIVGHNIKYDLLWVWDCPRLQAFLERGGEIYDTQYTEYCQAGFIQEAQMNAMNDIAEKYGGGCKLDAVKEMWEAGKRTSEIPEDMLTEYLIGSPAFGNPQGDVVGDIDNTWRIFVGQINRMHEFHHNFFANLRLRHDGLLATTEMEYNGIFADRAIGAEIRHEVDTEVNTLYAELMSHLPKDLPPEFKFNWGSPIQKSSLLFGGTCNYTKWVQHRDEHGALMYAKKKETWPLFSGVPTDPRSVVKLPSGNALLPIPVGVDMNMFPHAIGPDSSGRYYLPQDATKAGKNKGALKTKQVEMLDYDKPKGRQTNFTYTFQGFAQPEDQWQTSSLDAHDQPTYSTGQKIIEKLTAQGKVPFIKSFIRYNKAKKDMDTYYWAEEADGTVKGGMLTLVGDDGLIHHSINHTSTVTGRLSSSKPNMQTMPRGGRAKDGSHKGSRVKQMLRSRFGSEGEVAEIDYSQLEVVNQGVITEDKQLLADLNNKVDFHCKRLAAKKKMPYEEVWHLHHVVEDPDIGDERTNAKVYSFQSQYGASVYTIAYDTGMLVEEVEALKAADATLYPGVNEFDKRLEAHIERNAYPVDKHVFVKGERITLCRSHWDSPTGSRYVWEQHETPDFVQARGKLVGFSPTERKNYPMQGLGGEVIEVMIGKVFRYFLANKRFDGRVLMTNTVHDCMWLDGQKGYLEPVAKAVTRIMECVPQVMKGAYNIDVPVEFPAELELGADLYDMKVIKH